MYRSHSGVSDLHNALNIVVVAFWLLMQSFSVAHSYSQQLHHGDCIGGMESAKLEIAPANHDHAFHKHDHAGHDTRPDAGQLLDAGLSEHDAKLDCCDETQCKAGEMLLAHAANSPQQPSCVLSPHKSSSVSWSPGSFTPPPNTTV
jgi:hypothetical protein